MKSDEKLTIAVAVNDINVLRKNLFLSPRVLNSESDNQLIIKQNYSSASLAYNSAIEEAENDIIIFVHQDVYLPECWFSDLNQSISYLETRGIEWGVLGCCGSRKFAKASVGQVYTNGVGIHGVAISQPEIVDTLDEIVLIIRRSSGLRFDPTLPHFHLYGTDLCISAKSKGMACYAIPAFCIHNTNQILKLPREYWVCYQYIKKKWKNLLPIYTSCIKILSFESERYYRVIRELGQKVLGKKQIPKLRVEDPRTLLYLENFSIKP